MKMDGGVDAVRVVPIRMQSGGDPAEKLLAEGPPEGPKQFKLPDERMLTNRKQRDLAPIPVPDDKPMSSEPLFDSDPKKPPFPGPGMKMEEFLFTTPNINPLEVLPMLPFMPNPAIPNQRNPFIDGFFDPMPQDKGGIPNLIDANMLKPAGILSINKTYDI
tara:strand:+ start:322 stop:804 length:483 start_codon:yes stop_codon:yes gene_type:complete